MPQYHDQSAIAAVPYETWRDFLIKNPFDERYWGKEDRHWAIKMVKKGHNYLYKPEMSINHFWTSNGATWKGLG